MTKVFTYNDEVVFWKRQIKEHQLFIYYGIIDYALKNEALNLHNLWGDSMTPNQLSCLIEKTQQFQSTLLSTVKVRWIGWLSFSFIEHLQKELMYFKQKLQNQDYNLKEELEFWLWHHESEMAAAEKLLDPKEEEWCEKIKQYISTVKILKNDLQTLKRGKRTINKITEDVLLEYLTSTTQLEQMIKNKTVLSNIPLSLIQHVIREGERAILIFEAFNLL